MRKPHWSTISVRMLDGPELAGGKRLAILHRWLRREAPMEARFCTAAGETITDSAEVSWADFPLQDAADADRDRGGAR
jgi:hypothetical protein